MNKILSIIILLMVLASCASSRRSTIPPADGMSRELKAAGTNVEALSDASADKVALQVAATYQPWSELSIDGKINIDKLPVSPTMKMYMKHGEFIIISMRVPLMGEVARVEIDRDSILMVNKMNKVYAKESVSRYLDKIGADITNLQDLFLGRVFLMNTGTLSTLTAPLVDVSTGAGDTWIITPKNQDPRAQYGFTLYSDGKMLMACAFTPDEKYFASAEYDYDKSETHMNMDFKLDTKALKFTIECQAPNFRPNPVDPIILNKKWSKVSISQCLKFSIK